MSIDPAVSGGGAGGVSPDPKAPSSISGDQKAFNSADAKELTPYEKPFYKMVENQPNFSEKDKIDFAKHISKYVLNTMIGTMQQAAAHARTATRKMGQG